MSSILTGKKNQIAVNFTEEIWDKGNLKIADEILSKDFIDHDTVTGQLPGIEGYKQMVTEFRNAFPDLKVKNEDVIVEGDKGCCSLDGTRKTQRPIDETYRQLINR